MSSVAEARPPELAVETVHGVTVLSPARPRSGDEVTAVLAFRVGVADEAVTVRGITHLIEHLCLTRFDSPSLAWNGCVDLSRTMFSARGPADEVAHFLAAVTTGLHALPADRLDHERRVLQVESRSSPASRIASLHAMRFGLQGPGVAAYPEWGLEWLDMDALRSWADTWFTSSNAVLWSTGPLPGLELSLPVGQPRPPRLVLPDRALPAADVRESGLLALSSVVTRTAAHAAAARELEVRLRRLRTEEGVSYRTGVTYSPVSGEHAIVTATADVHAERVMEATHAFQAVLRDVVETGVTDEALKGHHRSMNAQLTGADAVTVWMDRIATRLLFRVPDPLDDRVLEEVTALTPEDIQRAGGDVLDQALLLVPAGGGSAVRPPFRQYEPPRIDPVEGTLLRGRRPAVGPTPVLVYSDAGVTHRDGDGNPLTIRFDSCAGVIAWQDGTRMLYGTDGSGLYLDAQQWMRFERIRNSVDRNATGPVALLPVSPDRGPTREVGPAWRLAQRLVDRLGWTIVALVAALVFGGLVGLVTVGIQRLAGRFTGIGEYLGDYEVRVLALVGLVLVLAVLAWRTDRRQARGTGRSRPTDIPTG